MKKIISLLVLVTIFLTCIMTPISAASPTTVTVSSEKAEIGGTVTVDVSISKTKLATYGIAVVYDPAVFEIVTITQGAMSKGIFITNLEYEENKGFATMIGFNDYEANGVLFTVTFKVIGTVEGDYPIGIQVDNITSADTTPIESKPVSGEITVKKPACNHKWDNGVVTKKATCMETGVKTYTCSVCGDTKDETVKKVSHTYGEWTVTKEPTCTAKGQRKHTCTVCHTTTSGTISAKGHDWGEWVVTTPATATENGVETKTCSECDAKETREIPAIGHTFGEWVETKAPTCTEKGEQTRTCIDEGCDAKETREVAALGHNYGDWTQTKAPTCTEVGEESRTCANCKGVEKRDVAKDSDNHSFGEWAVTTAPACGVKGEETRTCACGAKETREITEITHEWEWVVDKEATKTKDGSKHEECKHCGETRNEGTVIEKTGNGMLVFWIILIIIIVLGIVIVVIALIYKRKKANAK